MIEINVRDRNNIVTLAVPGKIPIKARSGSPYFYNSMELICIALGACFGGELVKFCSHNKLNPAAFESLGITIENFVPIIVIQHPPLDKEKLEELEYIATHCPVASMLKNGVKVRFIENTIPVEILTDETKRPSCCGG